MNTSGSQSYVSLSLREIEQRFQELMAEEHSGLSLEEPAESADGLRGAYNPYDHQGS
jgi:hypothetical protein